MLVSAVSVRVADPHLASTTYQHQRATLHPDILKSSLNFKIINCKKIFNLDLIEPSLNKITEKVYDHEKHGFKKFSVDVCVDVFPVDLRSAPHPLL
jgi:hypothetical protein